MSLRTLRLVCAAIFVAGIAGLIISSIAGNNNGVVLSAGIPTSIAALVLISASAVSQRDPIDAFDEARAEMMESRIERLVAAGSDEAEVRSLVREAIQVGKRL